MTMFEWESIHDTLNLYNVIAFPVQENESMLLEKQWHAQFGCSTEDEDGIAKGDADEDDEVKQEERWECFIRHNKESVLHANEAIKKFWQTMSTEFYLYYEEKKLWFSCASAPAPDLGDLNENLIAVPEDFSWCFAVTRHTSDGVGPFFVQK